MWRRLLASNVSDGEQRLRNILQDTFLATELEVQDVSGQLLRMRNRVRLLFKRWYCKQEDVGPCIKSV